MMKIFIFIIIIVSGLSLKAQNDNIINCFAIKTNYDASVFLTIDYQKNISLYSLNAVFHPIALSKKFETSIGVGYVFPHDEIFALWKVPIMEYGIVATHASDSTYYINGVMYHYSGTIDVYDSIPNSIPKQSYANYTYLKIPLIFKHEYYNRKNLSLSLLLKNEILIEIKKNIDYGDKEGYSYEVGNERKGVYFFTAFEFGIGYTIVFQRGGVMKNNPIVKYVTISINPRVSYQWVKFQSHYSKIYYGVSFGFKIPLN